MTLNLRIIYAAYEELEVIVQRYHGGRVKASNKSESSLRHALTVADNNNDDNCKPKARLRVVGRLFGLQIVVDVEA